MSTINNSDPPQIIFMEGWDGSATAGGSAGTLQHLWPGWRLWQTRSADHDSPTMQAYGVPATGPVKLIVGENVNHEPPGGYTGWYSDLARHVRLRSPENFNGLGLSCASFWRTGSGVDGEEGSGFSKIIDCDGSGPQAGAWLGFAFSFPSAGLGSGSIAKLKVWMGDATKNGERDSAGGYKDGTGVVPRGPGEPARWNVGEQLWAGPDGSGGVHEYQQQRLGLEITSGSTDNILIYRTSAGPATADDTTWSYTGSYVITHDVWYYGVWHVNQRTSANGISEFFMFNETTPIVKSTITVDNCRDMGSTIVSNLGFAMRGPDEGKGGDNFSGVWQGDIESATNEISIDDIVLLSGQKPAETFCYIATASLAVGASYTPHNAANLTDAVIEIVDAGPGLDRLPNTSSYAQTVVPDAQLVTTCLHDFPYTLGAASVYGVHAMAFCARDSAAFANCKQKVNIEGGVYTLASESIIPLPDTGQSAVPDADDPYVFIRSNVFYSLGDGTSFTSTTVETISSSVGMGT